MADSRDSELEHGSVQRPLLGAALALFAGSLAGASLELPLALLEDAATCAASGVDPGLNAIRAWARVALVASLALWTASALTPTASRLGRLRAALLLGVVFSAGAVRAADWRAGQPETDASGARIGRWSVLGSFADGEIGELDGAPERYALPFGIVAPGELVRIAFSADAKTSARGPVPGPNARRGLEPPRNVLPDELTRLAPAERTLLAPLVDALAHVRDVCLARVRELDHPLTSGLVGALLFGDTRGLPEGVGDLFVRTGTYHVLAISGLQVAMVAVLIVWPLGSLAAALVSFLSWGRVRIDAAFFRLALLFLFVPIAGSGAPVVRSAIAWGLGAVAPRIPSSRPFALRARTANADERRSFTVGRRADSLSLWSLALLLECLLRPDAPLSLSVELSYAATAGLIVGTGPILARLRAALPGRGRIASVDALGRARAVILHVLAQRALDATLVALAASCAAVLATLPFAWTRFGEWSPIGILATPLIVLPLGFTLAASWVWIAAPALVPEVLLDVPVRVMVDALTWLDRLPGSPELLPPRPFVPLALAALATIVWLSRSHRRAARSPVHDDDAAMAAGLLDGDRRARSSATALHASFASDARTGRTRALARATALLWAVLLVPWTLAPQRFELHALDAGSGTAVLFRAPGAGTWIFDAGSRDRPDVAREAVLPLLRAWDVAELRVVLSHADRDHDGALAHVVSRIAPHLWAGALPAYCDEALPRSVPRVDVAYGALVIGAPHARGGLSLTLERWFAAADNEGSRTLSLDWFGTELVLTGDAEAEGLTAWLAHAHDDREARLLLLPHHGSESEALGRLLRTTRPREVWVSASHEMPLAAELDRRALDWRWTARDGPLRLELEAR